MGGDNDTLEDGTGLRTRMTLHEFYTMDIAAVRTWFTVVGILAGVALSLWCVNIFIFKREEIVQVFRKYCWHTTLRNRMSGSPLVMSRIKGANETRLLAKMDTASLIKSNFNIPHQDSDNGSSGP